MRNLEYKHADSPLGPILLAADRSSVRVISFPEGKGRRNPEPGWIHADNGLLAEAEEQLSAYFDGRLREFDLVLEPEGSEFQLRVWRALCEIPYAETASYGEVAEQIGSPGSSRAVGAACGRNPLPIAIPCHRVVGKSGSLTGFGGGLDAKKTLLALEQSVAGGALGL